jgi:DNA-binding SARP family transcriptional activator
MPLTLRLLGPVDLSGGPPGAERLLAQPQLLLLLAYLALTPGRGFVGRDRLVGAFWPEQPEDRARSSLRSALYGLRGTLGGDVIRRRGEDVAIDTEAITCDAYEFTTALGDDALARALELYRGPLLDGIFPHTAELQQWLDEERDRYRAAAADAAWMLAERYESKGADLTSAARWARKAAKLARADERRIRRVMSLLDRAGDTAGAISIYEDFARYLARELDVEPSIDTRDLARSLRERRGA